MKEKYSDIKASIHEGDDDEKDFDFAKKNSNSKTPILDTFSRDLTKMAQDGKIDPIVGRQPEIERVSQILSRRKKNNPILLGEPGCVDGNVVITVRKVSIYGKHNIVIK